MKYDLDSILIDGKHEGFTIREVVDKDAEHLDELIEKKKIRLDQSAIEYLKNKSEELHRIKYEEWTEKNKHKKYAKTTTYSEPLLAHMSYCW